MASDWAKKTADKYIGKDGRAPTDAPTADATWRAEAETVRAYLRNAKSQAGRDALAASWTFEEVQ